MSRLEDLFVKHVTFPLWAIRDGDGSVLKYLGEVRQYGALNRPVLIQRQEEGIRQLLRHAYENTGYYKRVFDDQGFDPEDFSSRKDISVLPALTKELIRDNYEDLVARNFERQSLREYLTGGSTGVPLTFLRDPDCLRKRKAQEVFFDRWLGHDVGGRVALFVAQHHYPGGAQGFKARLRNYTYGRLLCFDPYNIADEYMEAFYQELKRFRPKVMKCFPNSLYCFAHFMKKRGLSGIHPVAVAATGETVHSDQKELFEDVFQCEVFERYGTIDAGLIASECREHDGLHVFMDGAYVEFVNDKNEPAREGEMASLLVTDLYNYGMPFIRYRIGDIGIRTERRCPCGSDLEMIERLYGRDRDILVSERGDPKPGYLFVEIFNKLKIPGQFQVLQEKENEVLIRVVRGNGFTDDHEAAIRKGFAQLLGGGVRVDVDYVDEIAREASGKYRYVHSKVSPFA